MHERCRLEEWRHMLSAPSGFPPSLVLFDATDSHPTHFFKDGREINVGDCALFQAVKAPPFIGIIRKLKTDKEGQLKLWVNWLYRPVDVKLPKGSSLEAAPNEIFYSFHRDEIPAVSLLHPCKVAFLKRGIELPQGFSSFVCRRVYDIANKRLWWLTDRDYTDDHQEEVNQLLDKTKHDMQAAVHNTARDGSSQQPKTTSESAQNGPSSSSQGKGKKRERGEQQAGHSKREKSVKSEDSDGCHSKRENSAKSEEISEITDTNGALVSVSSVDQLIRLMKQEKSNTNNKRKDGEIYPKRSLLARVIAATEKEECLHRFVQLGGLPILDDWLQEAHKCNKNSDSGSPRDGDKGLEELLLILLRALEKLPVDLVALKSCVVGKSVNNLRSHKNMEVQKKARKLVDTWKKRVDAEMKLSSEPMKSITSPSVSCSGKQLSADSSPSQSHLARATSGIGSEPSAKNSSGVKSEVNDSHPGEVLLTSKATKGGGVSSNASSKELHSKTAEVLSSSVKDEKSSGSSHPQSNNSQSFSSGPVKGEVNKSSVVKSVNAGTERHTSGKSLAWKNRNSSENVASSRCIDKGSSDSTRAANSSNQRLILRFPNPGRSSACVSGTPNPDANTAPISEASSPNLSEKHCNEVKPRAIHSPEGSTNAGKFEADVNEKGKTSSQLRMSRCVLEGSEADNNTIKDTPTSLIDPPAHSVEVKTETTHGTDNTVEGHLSLLVSLAAAESSKAEKAAKSDSRDVKRELEDHSHALKDGESVHFEAKIDMTSRKEGERNNNAETLNNDPVRIGEDIHSGQEGREHKHIGELPVPKTEQSMVETQQRLLDEAEKSDISEKITDEKVGGIDKKAEDLKSDHNLPERGTFEGEKLENVNVCKDDDGESGIKMVSSTKKVQMEVTEASVGGEKDSLEVSLQPLEEIERKVEIDGKLEHDLDGMKVETEIDDAAERAVSDAKLNMDSKTVAMLVEADMAPLACVDSSKFTHTAVDSINVENSNKCEMDEAPSTVPEVDESAINWRSSLSMVCKDDARGSSIAERPLFDLNEGLADEILQEGKIMPSNLSISSDSCYLADPILATTTTEGASVPEPLQCRDSVSTSGIQLADSFLTHERKRFESELNGNKAKRARAPLDIDLNIADERLSEDAGASLDSSFVSGSSRPMLDLNMSEVSDEPKSTQVLPNLPKSKGESQTIRDFDLNDGLLFEEVTDSPSIEEPTKLGSNNNVGVSTLPGLVRVGYSINPEIGNQLHRSSLNTNNPLPSSLGTVIPPFSITKLDTMSSKRTGFSSFSGDIYSTEVLPNTFSYTGLPFGGSVYPFPSASFATNSGPLPTTAAVPPHLVSPPFGRPPYVMGVPEVSGSDNGGRWSRPSLDLNAGPDASQDGRSGLAALKRVEPENGFDSFLPGFKHIKRR